MTPGSHTSLQDLFLGDPSPAELAYVVVPPVRVRQEQEAYPSRPPTGNSRDKATAAGGPIPSCQLWGTPSSPPLYRQGAESREGHAETWTLKQDYRRMGKWQLGWNAGQQGGAEDREAS